MQTKRIGLAVWVNNIRAAQNLKRIGNVHYISKRFKYVTMYVDAHKVEETMGRLRNYSYVTKVELSRRHEIPTQYENSKPDKAKEYDYRIGI